VAILLEAGAAVDKKCRNGSTALIWAVCREQKATTLQLLEAGADTGIMNISGETALNIAVRDDYSEISVMLQRETPAERQRREEEARRAEEQRQAEIRAAREAAEARFEKLKNARPQQPPLKRRPVPKP
jgi:ankyrin repeat protein